MKMNYITIFLISARVFMKYDEKDFTFMKRTIYGHRSETNKNNEALELKK